MRVLIYSTIQLCAALLPFLLYIIIVQAVEEAHPFSKFPMYSSFPGESYYYYIADENDNPVSTYHLLGITIDELTDMVNIRTEKNNVHYTDENGIKPIASECLKELKKVIPTNSNLKEIKWVKHVFYGDVTDIKEQKIILATCILN